MTTSFSPRGRTGKDREQEEREQSSWLFGGDGASCENLAKIILQLNNNEKDRPARLIFDDDNVLDGK